MIPSSDASAANNLAIAVIAVACRFPDAPNPDAFWGNLVNGRESIRHFSLEELPAPKVVDGKPAEKDWVPAGAVLEGADQFDAGFFGFIPRHAELLDPQQRLLLECAWEALESAGYPPNGYPDSVGVYVSVARSSYSQGALRAPVERLVAYAGEDKDFAATRISYKLNLTGPSVVVQSASSSSLVAVHLACESLLAGECDVALAGGACINFPQAGYVYDEALMLSPDGHCRAFDADASGTVTGNGAGLVALKCLNDALADGDPILAIIRGSAIGNDGAQKVDFFAPSVDGQARVIREAQAMASIDPATISYLEAHGTGTALGDPIEIEALRQAFAGCDLATTRCAIGSVKTNIGHLHTAAGIAGLIKTVLMLQHGRLVPSLHYRQPNPRIAFPETPFRVNTESQAWDLPTQHPRRAGVSAFGFGGTNAHVVLEE
ncbi:MAG: polyketide synthase, partial [Candidatus Competibacteraceae bacterium]|nr:polyketide synthase [Candidatus Competibacteraceae bacterium]